MITKTTAQIIEQEVCVNKRWVCVDDLKKELRQRIWESNEKFSKEWSEEYFIGYQNALDELLDSIKIV